jgi:drug/metabolite transporter (DMT)-like permease
VAAMINWMILIIMTMFGALGGYFFKKATRHGIALQQTFMINLFIGGTLYVGSALLNILLLTKMPYTIVYPLTSITYLWTLLFSYYFLSEKITKRKLLGVFFIIIGAFILSR